MANELTMTTINSSVTLARTGDSIGRIAEVLGALSQAGPADSARDGTLIVAETFRRISVRDHQAPPRTNVHGDDQRLPGDDFSFICELGRDRPSALELPEFESAKTGYARDMRIEFYVTAH